MRWTGQLLIVLALSSLGCFRGDWTTETLTLVDVTGTWEGPFRLEGYRGYERTIRWLLEQKGGKVRGEAQGPDGAPLGSIEGLVKGDVLSWQLSGALVKAQNLGSSASGTFRGDASINLDEMNGRADGQGCPCNFTLRRMSTEAIRAKQPQ